eukprot:3892604-Amphidinium_carterae.1
MVAGVLRASRVDLETPVCALEVRPDVPETRSQVPSRVGGGLVAPRVSSLRSCNAVLVDRFHGGCFDIGFALQLRKGLSAWKSIQNL